MRMEVAYSASPEGQQLFDRDREEHFLYSEGQVVVSAKHGHVAGEPSRITRISFLIPHRESSKYESIQTDYTKGQVLRHGAGAGASPDKVSESGDLSQSDNPRKPQRVVKRGGAARHPPTSRRSRREDAIRQRDLSRQQAQPEHGSLQRKSHLSLRGLQAFGLAKPRHEQSIARDWSTQRKRFVASVACISTALIGILLGIYAGLVPSIQYYIIDESHVTVFGNTGCFAGLAVTNFLFWPLPLLHGRKPYILASLAVAMPLLFPQALSVQSQRLTNVGTWRAILLTSRTLMGCSLGFASMTFHAILTDLFGASLMSSNPHQEVVDEFDTRRHGGGMGAWLGIWTWCWIGSLGVGFLVGAAIIDTQSPAWGFYVSIILIAATLVLNVICPEVRRSAYRRSIAEVRCGTDLSTSVARGEVKMHRVKTGPEWFGEEIYHGILLSLEMLRQPGFTILAIYAAWIYAQVVLIIVLLGSLASRFYGLRSPNVGLHVACLALGALLAIPFQKASIFSRSRESQVNTNMATLMEKRFSWTSHLLRRILFTLLLPVAAGCYTAVSSGPPIHISLPTAFTVGIGFLSCLAVSECNGLIMETFDTSDLSSETVGQQHGASDKNQSRKNYSSFPRITAGFATIHSLAFALAAGATALGGHIQRKLGQQVTTGVVAGILLFLTVLLLLVLVRFHGVRIIPKSKEEEMDKVIQARRSSSQRRVSMPGNVLALIEEEEAWKPVMLGNPVTKIRYMNLLELGGMSRWQEIRKKNKLIDEDAHLNRAAFDAAVDAFDEHVSEIRRDAHELLHKASLRSMGSRFFSRGAQPGGVVINEVEMENLTVRLGSTMGTPFIEREFVLHETVREDSGSRDEDPVGPDRADRADSSQEVSILS